MSTAEDIWLRRDNESEQSYEHFEAYKNLGLKRTLSKAAEIQNVSTQRLADLSSKHDWRRRVIAWDRHEAREKNRLLIAGAADMRERLAAQCINIQAQVTRRILGMTPEEIKRLTPSECALLFRVASDVEMKIRRISEEEGDPTPFTVVVNVIDSKQDDDGVGAAANRPAPPNSKPDHPINLID